MIQDGMNYSLRQAAEASGVSKTKLHRAIKAGTISAVLNESGAYEIDPSELHRVFPPKCPEDHGGTPGLQRSGTMAGTEVERLFRERLGAVEADRERDRREAADQIADLRRRLDAEAEERRKLTAILTDQRKPEPEQARKGLQGFLHRLAG
jgi:hypothetical protein